MLGVAEDEREACRCHRPPKGGDEQIGSNWVKMAETTSNDKLISAIQLCRSDAPMVQNLMFGFKKFAMLDLSERARFHAVHVRLQSMLSRYRAYIREQPLSKLVHSPPLVLASAQIRQGFYQGIKQGVSAFETVLASRPSCGSNLATINQDVIPLVARHLFNSDLSNFGNCCVIIRHTVNELLPLVTLEVATTHVVGSLATVEILLQRRQMGPTSQHMRAELIALDETNQPLKGAIQQFQSSILLREGRPEEVKIRFLKRHSELRLACRVSVYLPADPIHYYFGQSEILRVRATQARKRARVEVARDEDQLAGAVEAVDVVGAVEAIESENGVRA